MQCVSVNFMSQKMLYEVWNFEAKSKREAQMKVNYLFVFKLKGKESKTHSPLHSSLTKRIYVFIFGYDVKQNISDNKFIPWQLKIQSEVSSNWSRNFSRLVRAIFYFINFGTVKIASEWEILFFNWNEFMKNSEI